MRLAEEKPDGPYRSGLFVGVSNSKNPAIHFTVQINACIKTKLWKIPDDIALKNLLDLELTMVHAVWYFNDNALNIAGPNHSLTANNHVSDIRGYFESI